MVAIAAPAKTRPRVFLSYAQEDRALVERLASDLTNRGIDVLRPDLEAEPGESVFARLGEAIAKSDAVVVLLSKAAVRSPWVTREVAFALAERSHRGAKALIPVLVDKDVEPPPFLRSLRYLDLSSSDAYNRSVEELIRTVTHPERRREATDDIQLQRRILDTELQALRAQQLELERRYHAKSLTLSQTLFWALIGLVAAFGVALLGLSIKSSSIATFLGGVATAIVVTAVSRLMRSRRRR